MNASARRPGYAAAYRKGWAASARGSALDEAEDRYVARYGRAEHDAWLDGWLDYAAGRPKWHLRDCPDHDACP